MNKYDELINHLASQTPELPDADALCDSIMESLPEQHPVQKESLWIGIARWTTSIAAIFLLVLFIDQSSSIPSSPMEPDYSQSLTSLQSSFERINTSTSLPETIHQIVEEKQNRVTLSKIKKSLQL